jgi:hypothetical protein
MTRFTIDLKNIGLDGGRISFNPLDMISIIGVSELIFESR